jgi:hypothetical protein
MRYDTVAERIEMKHKKAAVIVAGLIMALGSAAPAMADSSAEATTGDSPGVLSGNVVQVPLHIPITAAVTLSI